MPAAAAEAAENGKKLGQKVDQKTKKYTATGLPMWSPTIVLTGLDLA